MITLKHLTKQFSNHQKPLFHDVNLSFPSAGMVVIFGPSGAGKTTLLTLLGGQSLDYEGEIIVGGHSLKALDEKTRADYRLTTCGFLFQHDALLFDLSRIDNVALVTYLAREKGDKERKARQVLEKVGFLETRGPVATLSGGEKQRLALARAIYHEPRILLCDEPTAALDDENAERIIEILARYAVNHLVIVVSHDQRFASRAHQLYVLNDGELVLNRGEKEEETHEWISSICRRRHPFGLLLRLLWGRMKRHQYRTWLTIGALSMGLFLGGMGDLLARGLSHEMEATLATFSDGRTWQMVPSSESEEINQSAIDEEKLASLHTSFTERISWSGYRYQVDWSEHFIDRQECRLVSSVIQYTLPLDFTMLNEFRPLQEAVNVFPHLSELASDELVISLPPSMMRQWASYLEIGNPSYEKVGTYLSSHNVRLAFFVANHAWVYEDERIFTWKGIVEGESLQIYHSDPLFNVHLLEDEMRFDATLSYEGETSYPWTLRKRSIVEADESFYEIAWTPKYEYLRFEHTNYSSHSWSISVDDRPGVSYHDVVQISRNHDSIRGYLLSSSYGYGLLEGTILHGCQAYFYLGREATKLDEIEDHLPPDLSSYVRPPDSIAFHSLLAPDQQNFAVIPFGFDQWSQKVGLSTTLATKLGVQIGDLICYLYGIPGLGGFYRGAWVVDYVIAETGHHLYVPSSWSYRFYLEDLRLDPNDIVPEASLFYNHQEKGVTALTEKLTTLYPQYRFRTPGAMYAASFAQVTSTIDQVLLIFSAWMLLFSFLLLRSVLQLYLWEMRDEIALLERLGALGSLKGQSRWAVTILFWLSSFLVTNLWFFMFFLCAPLLGSLLPFTLVVSPITFLRLLLCSLTIIPSGVLVLPNRLSKPRKKLMVAK